MTHYRIFFVEFGDFARLDMGGWKRDVRSNTHQFAYAMRPLMLHEIPSELRVQLPLSYKLPPLP